MLRLLLNILWFVLGGFVAGDLVTWYAAFALVSLAAFGMVVHDRTEAARRAGSIYLLLAVLGEVCLLLAFALLAVNVPGNTLSFADVVAALPTSPTRDVTIGLLIAGFGLKAGLVPLHVWLPLAHPEAPHAGLGRAERAHHQGRHHRTDPVPAV